MFRYLGSVNSCSPTIAFQADAGFLTAQVDGTVTGITLLIEGSYNKRAETRAYPSQRKPERGNQ